jgi:hypothetical protein
MSRDPSPPGPRRGRSCKIRRDPGEYGSVPALLPRARCTQAVIPPHNPTPLGPQNRLDLDRMSRDPGPSEPRRGRSCKIRRDPSEDGSVPALLPRRCALRRPSYRRTTRPPRPPKPLGSRPVFARSKPSRATAREILQNKARSERRRVGTRPSPTTERYTLAVVRPHNPTPPDPKTARISTRCRKI